MKKFKDLTFIGKVRRIGTIALIGAGLCFGATYLGMLPGVTTAVAKVISAVAGSGVVIGAGVVGLGLFTEVLRGGVNLVRRIFNINGYRDRIKNNKQNKNNNKSNQKNNEKEEELKIVNKNKNIRIETPRKKRSEIHVPTTSPISESVLNINSYNNTSTRLNNGNLMPRVSFGTWGMFDRDDGGYAPTLEAIRNGCRNIDTASVYRTETGVGQAIKDSGVKRSEIYVSTKLNPQEAIDFDTTIASVKESLKKMGLKYVDTVYIHAPERHVTKGNATVKEENNNNEIYKALLKLQQEGLIKNIGVSNFTPEQIEKTVGNTNIYPQLVQMPLSVGYREPKLLNYCKEHKIQTVAYSPLASGYALKDPKVIKLAEKYGVTPADICLDYAMQLTGSYCFRSVKKDHIQSGLNVSKILSKEDLLELAKVNIDYRAWDYNTGLVEGKDILSKKEEFVRIK